MKYFRYLPGALLVSFIIVVATVIAQIKLDQIDRQSTANNLETSLNITRASLESWLEHESQSAKTWANDPLIKAWARSLSKRDSTPQALSKAPEQDALSNWLNPICTAKAYVSYLLINKDGTIIASKSPNDYGAPSFYQDKEDLRAKLEAKETVVTMPSSNKRGEENIKIATPIFRKDNLFAATLVFELSPEQHFASILTQARIGKTGESYAFSKDSLILTPSRFEDELWANGILAPGQPSQLNIHLKESLLQPHPEDSQTIEAANTFMTAVATMGISGTETKGYIGYTGRMVIGSWVWLDEFQIGIATEIESQEAYASLRLRQKVLIIVVAVTALLLAILIVIYSQSKSKFKDLAYKRQRELLWQKASFKAIFENAGDAIISFSPDLRVNSFSPAAENTFGYINSDIKNLNIRDFFEEKSQITFDQLFKNLNDDDSLQDSVKAQLTGKHKNGHTFPAEISLGKGAALGKTFYVAIVRDVTIRLQATQELKKSKQQLSTLISNIPGAVFSVNCVKNWEVEFLSEEIEKITGYPNQRFLNRSISEYSNFIHLKDVTQTKKLLLKSIRAKQSFELDYRLIRKDKSVAHVHEKGIAIFSEEGKLLRVDGVIIDVTEKWRTQRELLKSKEAAESANKAKTAFLANMSHEIRTPMNAILGYSQLINNDFKLSDDNRENISIVLSSGERLLNLINDILEISKIEAGHTTLVEIDFDLYAMVNDIIRLLSLKAKIKKINLAAEIDESVPQFAFYDESKIRQILTNLIGNAIKFTETGGVTLEVNTTTESNGQHRLTFSIEDSGCGIAQAEQQKLFERFQQTASGKRAQEGTGLGLAICKQYAELMQGDIFVISEEQMGSIFTLNVPFQEGLPAKAIPSVPTNQILHLHPRHLGLKILIVDDKRNNRHLLEKLLEQTGFTTKSVNNGKEAIEANKDWAPVLILMDMYMPEVDGYEATKAIKASTGRKPPFVVVVTASALEEDREAIMKCGADFFVRKPFKNQDLLALIGRCLNIEYATDNSIVEDSMDNTNKASINEQDLIAELPQASISKIREFAQMLDTESISDLCLDLKSDYPDAAKLLESLMDDYSFEKILQLVDYNEDTPA